MNTNRILRNAKRSYWTLQNDGLIQWLLCQLWNIILYFDNGEMYEGENAPYCGHAYYGYNGRLIKTHYTEVNGGGSTTFSVFGYKLYHHDDEGYYIAK